MANVEFWIARPTHYWGRSTAIDPTFSFVHRYEDAGLDGLLFFDTQNLPPECYVLATAAKETTRLQLGTGVTNPLTRHAAITASAMMTLQVVSNGRAYLGIGRGDSALAHLGYSPAALKAFAEYLASLQSYMRGEDVAFPSDANIDELNLGDQPEASRIQWLENIPKVPVGVAATGPRVISMAATTADRVDLMLGASPDRVEWGVDVAREARRSAGLDRNVPISAYVNLIVHDDREQAWRMAAPALTGAPDLAAPNSEVVRMAERFVQEVLPKFR